VNLLPWLLSWPPSRRTVVGALVLTAFSAGTLVLFDSPADETSAEVSVERVDLSVGLNDETDLPDADSGTVLTCLSSGTPGDAVSVVGDVVVEVPPDPGHDRLRLVVSLAHTDATTTTPLDDTGTVTASVFWLLDDDETLSPGGTATVQLRVRGDDGTLATATRQRPVEPDSRSHDC
jgi:hypothetical protein